MLLKINSEMFVNNLVMQSFEGASHLVCNVVMV